MKTIGLIGGMSWESTVTYYQRINETIKEELGGLNSAKILLYSVNFAEIEACQANGEWEKSGEILAAAAKNLEKAGAELMVLCTNTMHNVAPQIQKQIRIPLIHIAETTADALIEAGVRTVALLGTKYTMTQDFYKEKLLEKGLAVVIPDAQDIELVNHIIYDELCLGIISDKSRGEFSRIINQLKKKGANGVILGCTEIGLLIQQEDSPLPVFDTAEIHAQQAALESIR